LAQLGAFIAISVISLRALPASEGTGGLGNSGGTAVTLNSSVAWLLSIICGAALVFSIFLLVLVRAFTKIILEITLLLSVLLSVAYAVYLWSVSQIFFSSSLLSSTIAHKHHVLLLQGREVLVWSHFVHYFRRLLPDRLPRHEETNSAFETTSPLRPQDREAPQVRLRHRLVGDYRTNHLQCLLVDQCKHNSLSVAQNVPS
jgi:hypothetical protein